MAPYNDANMAFILCCIITLFVVIGTFTTHTDLYTVLLAIAVLFTPCLLVILTISGSHFTQPLRPTFNGQPLDEV